MNAPLTGQIRTSEPGFGYITLLRTEMRASTSENRGEVARYDCPSPRRRSPAHKMCHGFRLSWDCMSSCDIARYDCASPRIRSPAREVVIQVSWDGLSSCEVLKCECPSLRKWSPAREMVTRGAGEPGEKCGGPRLRPLLFGSPSMVKLPVMTVHHPGDEALPVRQ
ncbi:hypothetical protein R6Z07M_015412 [Ovis aries]